MRTSFFLTVAAIFVSIASAAPLRGDVLEAREPIVKPVADYYPPSDIKREEDAEERGYSMYGWKRDSATPAATATATPAPKKIGPVADYYNPYPWKREDVEEEKREEEERGYSMYGWKRSASSAAATATAATKPKPVEDAYYNYSWKRDDDAPEAAKRTTEEESQ